jgi:hypothetical protein
MSTEILKSKEVYDQAVQQFLKLSQEVDIFLICRIDEENEFRIPIYVVLFFLNKLPIVFSIIDHHIYENMHFIWSLLDIDI